MGRCEWPDARGFDWYVWVVMYCRAATYNRSTIHGACALGLSEKLSLSQRAGTSCSFDEGAVDRLMLLRVKYAELLLPIKLCQLLIHLTRVLDNGWGRDDFRRIASPCVVKNLSLYDRS